MTYTLIDSGNERKLERFGDKILIRPSTLCIWKPKREALWNKADAEYLPKEGGWRFQGKSFESWTIKFDEWDVTMELRLQRNGQVGIFPEHMSYLSDVLGSLPQSGEARVLSLFAFTGLATTVLAKRGVSVTHIDMLKAALDWTRRNLELSSVAADRVRLIPEEALLYLKREQKRGSQYDAVILDPPSFSRIAKDKEWKLDEIVIELLSTAASCLKPDGGTLFFTCHHGELSPDIIGNLLGDCVGSRKVSWRSAALALAEEQGSRKIPAGFLVQATITP